MSNTQSCPLSRGGKPLILVVEDEPALRELLVECLSDEGYAVIDAPDGFSALRLLEAQGPPVSILVTDVRMPGINGPELVRAAKQRAPEINVVYISGYTDDHFVPEELGLGNAFIQKPFTGDTLCAQVAALLHPQRNP